MLSAEQCRKHLPECLDLANCPDNSVARNALLLEITRLWLALAVKMEEYEELLKKEHR